MFREVAAIIAVMVLLARAEASAQDAAAPAGPTPVPAKAAKDLIRRQAQAHVAQDLYAKATPENTRIVVNLAAQRAYLMVGEDVCIDTPISSGRRVAPTPTGAFTVLEKIRDHSSASYGDFVDSSGRVVRSGVSMKLDAAPAGARYVSVPMKFYCRFTDSGFALHDGLLPGYPAAQGSVRLPSEIARLLFEKVRVGTPVEVRAE
jgi:lipoprotein-anchoring transpeptidase ErfK/SrfK